MAGNAYENYHCLLSKYNAIGAFSHVLQFKKWMPAFERMSVVEGLSGCHTPDFKEFHYLQYDSMSILIDK